MQQELDKLQYGNCDISDWEGRLNTNSDNPALTGLSIYGKTGGVEVSSQKARETGDRSLFICDVAIGICLNMVKVVEKERDIMAKYNVHSGHNAIVPGANKYLNEVTENRKVKNKVISYLKAAGHTVYDCTDDDGTTQSRNLGSIVEKCNAHTVDLDIGIHLNAGGGTGTEVLYYYDSSEGKDMAAKVSEKVAAAFGWKDRGAKARSDLYVLNNTRAVAILVECCFVDSRADAAKWDVDKCARAIVEGVTGKTVSNGASVGSYYKAFSSRSIVDGLKSIGEDSSMVHRKKIAAANDISSYTGTAAQNKKMLNLAKQGKLKKV